MTNFLPAALAQRLFFVLLGSLFTLSAQTVCAEELAAPEFSHESGFYPEEFELVISHPDPEAKIYYTLDGSDPDPENLKGTTFRYKNEYAQPPSTVPTGEFLTQEYKTFVYDKPIVIKDRTYEPDRLSQISTTFDAKPNYFPKPERKLKNTWGNKIATIANKLIGKMNKVLNKITRHIKKYILNIESVKVGTREYIGSFDLDYEPIKKYLYKGTVIKAIAVGKINNNSKGINKVFFLGNKNQFSLPIVNITVPENLLFDYDIGTLVAGATFDEWVKAGSFGSFEKQPWKWPANWRTKNRTPAYLTIMEPERNKLSESFVMLRIHGNASRRFALKSLRIYPEKHKNGIELDLFRDGNNLGFDRVNLRNGGSNGGSNFPTDAAIHMVMKGLNFAAQRYQPVSVFINGEYYGLLNARDRKDHYYISSLYSLPNKKIDLLKGRNTVQKGDSSNWEELLKFVEEYEDKNNEYFYNEIAEAISIKNFIDYYVAELFIANADWPNNNIAYWRYRGTKKQPITKQGYTDGRWRWIMYDTDAAGQWADKPDLDMLSYATAVGSTGRNPDWSTLLLRKLLENKEIKESFIIRFTDLLNTYFLPDRTTSILKSVREGVIDEMPAHIERWSQRPKDLKTWDEHISKLTRFFEQRPQHQWQHLQEFFQLDERFTAQLNISQQGRGKIKLNTLILGDDPNQKYDVTDTPLFFPWSGQYFKNMPLTIEALPENGYAFSHWEVSGHQLTPEQKMQSKLVLKPQDNLKIKAVMSQVAKP